MIEPVTLTLIDHVCNTLMDCWVTQSFIKAIYMYTHNLYTNLNQTPSRPYTVVVYNYTVYRYVINLISYTIH